MSHLPPQQSLPQFDPAELFNSNSPQPSVASELRPQQLRTRAEEDIIGFVLRNKKFRCSKENCANATFGRQADLRRHFDSQHARNRAEYYCPILGCSRSIAPPPPRNKGRSFGTRKDKCEEHIRNVHKDHRDARKAKPQQYSPRGSF